MIARAFFAAALVATVLGAAGYQWAFHAGFLAALGAVVALWLEDERERAPRAGTRRDARQRNPAPMARRVVR